VARTEKDEMMGKWMLCAVLLGILPALACSLSVDIGGETPEPTAPAVPTEALPTRVATQESPTPVPPTPSPLVPTPTVPNWPVVLADDFDDPESGFVRSSDERNRLFYEDGQYSMGVVPENSIAWSSRSGSLLDFVMEVAVTADAEVGFAGVVFHKQGDSQFYTFAITPEGQYSLMTPGLAAEQILDWEDSSHIRTGAETNLLRVVRVGATVTLYVNGQYLESVRDTTFTEGEVGLIVGTLEGEAHALFHFDDLRVYASIPMVPPTGTPTLTPTITPTRAPATVVPPSPTPLARGPVEFDPIIFAQGLNAEHDPIMPGTSFPRGTTIVYAIFAGRGMYQGLEADAIWYHNGQEYSSDSGNWQGTEERGRWWWWLGNETGSPLPSGHYTLSVSVHGEQLQSGSFLIQ
jgi:hypothetical protein